MRYNNAILAIDIKSVPLNVKVQSALGLVLCNFSWYIFPGGPFKSTTEKKKEKKQWKHDHKSRFGIVYLMVKTGDLKSTQNWIQFFSNKKFRYCIYFLTCILPDYMAHDILKEFFKNSHFVDMTAGFLPRCQNLLRQISPKMTNFQTWKKLIFTNNAL